MNFKLTDAFVTAVHRSLVMVYLLQHNDKRELISLVCTILG